MEFIQRSQREKTLKETSSRQVDTPQNPDMNNSFGDPLNQPRVGSEYQVEIPPLLTESELPQYLSNPGHSEAVVDVSHSFFMGLSIPVTWVSDEVNIIKDEGMKFHDNLSRSVKIESTAECQSSSHEKDPASKVDTVEICLSNDHCPVPGLSTDTWSDFEIDCFILGLYIFGKNLYQVQRFVERKHMGQILSFYYGRFYRSAGYCRWSDWRKMKGRKSMGGHRFFTGSRQQELYSRLLPRLSEGCRNTLQEVSKAFAEGRALLEDYVSTLKNVAGIHALIDAISIGKSHDLTNVETSKSVHNSICPNIPAGKSCYSLTCSDIIKLLTGDVQLSKARSTDLFWEAVWPRLLARGWHSEQPKSDGCNGSNGCLVFLMPGVKKFSRRKLKKGGHYFDSVADVLKRVASEPALLMLDEQYAEENIVSDSKEANGWVPEVNSDDSSPDHGRHCYLQPRFSRNNKGSEELTIVDTTLIDGEKPSVVRESRSLPVETKTSVPVIQSKVTEMGLPGNSIKELGATDIPLSSLRHAVSSSCSKGLPNIGGDDGRKRKMSSHSSDPVRKPVSLSSEAKTSAFKHQLACPRKLAKPDRVVPVVKGQRLTASSKVETMENLQVAATYVLREPHCVSSLPIVDKRGAAKARRSQKKLSSIRFSDASQEQKRCKGMSEKTCVKREVELLVGLKLPQIPAKHETAGHCKAKAENNHSGLNAPEIAGRLEAKAEDSHSIPNATGPCTPHVEVGVPESSDAVRALQNNGASKKQPTTGGRRHSMRKRPMSTKALEALESSFLNQKPGKKCQPPWTYYERSRHPLQPYTKNDTPSDGGVHVVDTEANACDNTCDGRSVAPDKPLIRTAQEAAAELLELSRCSTLLETSQNKGLPASTGVNETFR
ncbi:hypothetical protein Ancab_024186 [Ancistrocladus abbreviatus]